MEPGLLDGAMLFFESATNDSLVIRADRVAMCVLILEEARP